ncbi:MAG: hypothetical protein PHH70_04055 [Candidatus Gracilibacteria bacterium]|nr:hypothetical protein [Candidatus Gracilibacteria bacterium]
MSLLDYRAIVQGMSPEQRQAEKESLYRSGACTDEIALRIQIVLSCEK